MGCVRVPRPPALFRAAWRISWALLVSLATAGAAAKDLPPIEDTLAQRLKACSACHGPQGRATNQGYFPRIAGKPAGYLYNQLVNFREGRRRHEAMTYLIDHMSDAYLREIADHFAGLDLPYPAPQTQTAARAALERGEQLVRHGDPARGIPACSTCHGTSMTGIAPAMPGLLGLPRDYLLGQFGGWRNGERRRREHRHRTGQEGDHTRSTRPCRGQGLYPPLHRRRRSSRIRRIMDHPLA